MSSPSLSIPDPITLIRFYSAWLIHLHLQGVEGQTAEAVSAKQSVLFEIQFATK